MTLPTTSKRDERLASAFEILDTAYNEYAPTHVFGLFSGGHDSATATAVAQAWAKQRKLWLPVAHINTGTGIAETHDYVLDTCEAQHWPLFELHPPRSYRSLVLQVGFPGPGYHDRMAYPRLKERCIRNLIRLRLQHDKDSRVMLISGVRSDESVRRMAHVDRIQVEDDRIWAAPIWNWTKGDCNEELEARGIARNDVADLLGMSGECLCGAMASKGELAMLESLGFTEKVAEIRALEDEAEAAGIHACKWGVRPPRVAKEQMKMFLLPNTGSPMLCVGCGKDGEYVEDEE